MTFWHYKSLGLDILNRSLLAGLFIFILLSASPAHAVVVVNENSLVSGTYTVPTAGQVTITITGADGGDGSTTNGGSGATVSGCLRRHCGQVIRYVVGGAGNTTMQVRAAAAVQVFILVLLWHW